MIVFLLLSLSVELDRDTITVGDPVNVIVRGKGIDSASVIMPDTFPDIAVLKNFKKNGDSLTSFSFTSFSTGSQSVYVLVDGDTLTVAYHVKSVLGPENKGMSPIRGPYGFFNWHYLLWLLVVPVVFVIYYAVRKRRSKSVIVDEPQLEPGEEALKNLSNLEEKIEEWDWNRLYTGLSYIARRYIERKTDLPAVETTTSELIRLIRRDDLDIFNTLVSRFSHWDLIKFADEDSCRDEFERDMDLTNSVITDMEEIEEDAS